MNALTIDLSEGPLPFVTSDGMAARAAGISDAQAYDAEGRVIRAERYAARRLLHGDRLLHLRERRQITAAEVRAGREIELLILSASCAGSPQARSQFRERLAETTGGAAADFWLVLMEAEALRYGPWQAWARAFPVTPNASLEDLTRLVVCDGFGVRQVAIKLGTHKRRILGLLRRSLHRYAVLGGWQEGENPPSPNRA